MVLKHKVQDRLLLMLTSMSLMLLESKQLDA